MSGEPGAAPRSLLLWLWRGHLGRHRWSLLAALVLMAVEGASLGLLASRMEPMFDRVFVGGERAAIWPIGLAVAGIFALRALSAFLSRVVLASATERMAATLRGDLVRRLMALDLSWHQAHPPGHLIERVHGDVQAIQGVLSTILAGARDAVALLSLLAVALLMDWRWTLAALAGVPLLVAPALLAQGFVRRRAAAAREVAARMSTRLDEIFHGLQTVKLNAIEAHQARRYDALGRERVRAEVRGAAGRAATPALVDLMTGAGFLLVLGVGGAQVAGGAKTVGEFVAFFTAMSLAFEPLRRLASIGGAWSQAAASVARLRAILDERPRLALPARPLPPPQGAPAVEFRDVRLAYGGQPALRGLSFTAEGGRTTALVGPSGAGKTTVFQALTRLADPDGGEVLVGGVPVSALSLPDLRALFSVVSQDAPLFDESVRDNILLGTEGVPEARLMEAVEAAHLPEVLRALPRGLDTPAGPRGSALSGGQRQRVAIARALLRPAPVLLLDEATSALDALSEARVQEALGRLSAGRTTLVVAHRLSTVRAAHRIVVMDRGRAVEEGTHGELLARGGLYAELHALQFRDDERGDLERRSRERGA